MYYQDESGQAFETFKKLQTHLSEQNEKLVFAMNGGMFTPKGEPAGLYIEKGKRIKDINRNEGPGNFHLMPNGVFYLTTGKEAIVVQSDSFTANGSIEYATQSGPMLLIDGEVHTAFNEGSKNRYIRNGVGILPNGKVLFAISNKAINFWDFAHFFKKNGCENALYLDGAISQCYLPEKGLQNLGGKFGVIIAESVAL